MSDTPTDLVACNCCGVVYVREAAARHESCPTCDITVKQTTAEPRLGRVHKWWTEVDR